MARGVCHLCLALKCKVTTKGGEKALGCGFAEGQQEEGTRPPERHARASSLLRPVSLRERDPRS